MTSLSNSNKGILAPEKKGPLLTVRKSLQLLRRNTKVFASKHASDSKLTIVHLTSPPSPNQLPVSKTFTGATRCSRTSRSSAWSKLFLPSQFPYLRYTNHSLPSIESLELFFYGYPKEMLIIEAAEIVDRLQRGEYVGEEELFLVKSQLNSEIERTCTPGTLDYFSWQVLLDLWRRIPDNQF
ncbi:hypothetical protein G9A89_015256 [Geosiphon pyriformis]|nr:hypothetical protein G9A89_015256 [Geosiphon pyriformis]